MANILITWPNGKMIIFLKPVCMDAKSFLKISPFLSLKGLDFLLKRLERLVVRKYAGPLLGLCLLKSRSADSAYPALNDSFNYDSFAANCDVIKQHGIYPLWISWIDWSWINLTCPKNWTMIITMHPANWKHYSNYHNVGFAKKCSVLFFSH